MSSFPQRYKDKKYPLLELAGCGIVLLLLIITLTRSYIRYDWLLDTIWLLSATFLSLLEWNREKPFAKFPAWLTADSTLLLLGLYLFLYHFMAFSLSLSYGGFDVVLYLAAAAVYGAALYIRAAASGIDIRAFKWKNMLHYLAWPLSIAISVCLFAMFFPMTKWSSMNSLYGPGFGYTSTEGYGYNNWGYTYYTSTFTVKGYMAYWGQFAGLLLLFMMAFHLLRFAGGFIYPKLDMFFKIAVPILIAWWFFGAKGYNSLGGFGNILFIPAMALMVFAVYFPGKLGEMVKEKGLVKK